MKYSNSKLVDYVKLSPNNSGERKHSIDTITIHCVVGQCSVETLGSIFASKDRRASSNYGIGSDGRIGMYCEEKNRSWCSSSSSNDNRAITIEVASDTKQPYAVKDNVMNSLIKLLIDICKRNGIKELKWVNDSSLVGQVDKQNMTVHRWFSKTNCPGEYLMSKMGDIAEEVNKALKNDNTNDSNRNNNDNSNTTVSAPNDAQIMVGNKIKLKSDAKQYDGKAIPQKYLSKEYTIMQIKGDRVVIGINNVVMYAINKSAIETNSEYRVKVLVDYLNIRSGIGTSCAVVGVIRDKGVYTIVQENNGWGKLKSGAGWIQLNAVKRL